MESTLIVNTLSQTSLLPRRTALERTVQLACIAEPREHGIMEFGILLPSKPHTPFVLDANGKPKLVPEDEEVTMERTEKQGDEMVANQAVDNLDMDRMLV